MMHTSMTFVPLSLLMLLGLTFVNLYRQKVAHIENVELKDRVKGCSIGWPKYVSRYLVKYTKRGQIVVTFLALIALPIYYGTLELPKLIINHAIIAEHFPLEWGKFTIEKIEFLFLLSIGYLILILGNGLVKFIINTYKGGLAERVIRRLRLSVIRQYRKEENLNKNSNAMIPMISQEVEPIGGFAADIISIPLVQGGTLLTIFLFFLMQDMILALAAISMLPLQIFLIPRLQKKVNILARKRVKEVRHLSELLPEKGKMREQFFSLRKLQSIRLELYRKKFFLKALNNFLISITPFFFYSVGGVLVIEGRISLGTLIAAIAAYKDLSSPIKELLQYYQRYEDVKVRYVDLRHYLNV
ncbi:hypothetical protein [Curvivirga sp.]|uniref:hypothetical protein n=1 Tax=Curvivirga sp. TaxID=2856848 RepID=UPI003B5936E9